MIFLRCTDALGMPPGDRDCVAAVAVDMNVGPEWIVVPPHIVQQLSVSRIAISVNTVFRYRKDPINVFLPPGCLIMPVC